MTGAGVSIALAADIVIAAEPASFVLTFSPKLGLIPDLGAPWKLGHSLGWARAHAITLLGDRISAAQALEWGMIWRCVPDADLQGLAHETATRVGKAPPNICRDVRHAYEAALAFQQKRGPDFHRAL
jgi:2-(1,2-epoxy-1,2-dihydrophenyl)acetyl-CoA isomerase